jgi:O-antigen/teichoic acid export membrane protein
VATGLLALLLVMILTPITSLIFNDLHGEYHPRLFLLGGLVLFCSNVGNATAIGLLRVFDGFRALALVKLAGHVFKLTATCTVLFALGWGARGVLAIAVLANLLTTLGLAVVAYRQLDRRIPVRTTPAPFGLLRPRMREMRGFVLNMYGVSLAAIPTRDLDVNILGGCTTAAVIGTYKVARDFMGAIWQVSDPLLFVLYPEFTRLWARQDFSGLRRFLRWGIVGLLAAAVLLCGAAYFIVPPVIELALGPQFVQAGTYFRWMLFGALAWMPLLWVNPLMMAAGRANLFFRSVVAVSATVVLLDVLLIPRWGGAGAAIAYAIGHVVGPLTSLWLAKSAGIFTRLREGSQSPVQN